MATDLRALQNRLNSDNAFKSEFLREPVQTLEAAGLILPDAAKARLIELVNALSTNPPSRTTPTIQILIEL